MFKTLLICCVSGNGGSAPVQREGVWSNNRQKEAVWMAGSDFGPICSHGQWILSVSSFPTRFAHHQLRDLRWLFVPGSPWRSWTFWTRCQRSKWVWPTRLTESPCPVSQVCSSLGVYVHVVFWSENGFNSAAGDDVTAASVVLWLVSAVWIFFFFLFFIIDPDY